MQNNFRHITIGLLALLLAGCSSTKEDKYEEKPVTELYNKAQNLYEKGEYKKSAKAYEEVIRQHPYSQLATESQLKAAEAYYNAQEFEEAIASINVFLQWHPGHERVAYAYYLRGLCYYIQIKGVEKDQEMTENALHTFQEIIKRFSHTKYARDAKLKIDLIYEYLAGRDMEVGRLYQRQRSLLGAMTRFRKVVTRFETTSHVPEALHRLVEIYLSLGLIKEGQATARILGHNHRHSTWYEKTHALLKSKNLHTSPKQKNLSKTWESSSEDASTTNHP